MIKTTLAVAMLLTGSMSAMAMPLTSATIRHVGIGQPVAKPFCGGGLEPFMIMDTDPAKPAVDAAIGVSGSTWMIERNDDGSSWRLALSARKSSDGDWAPVTNTEAVRIPVAIGCAN